MSSLAEVTRELTRTYWAISPPAGRAIAISRLQSVSLPPVDMIAIDVRLCDSTSSDLTHEKHTEVVLVLPPRSNERCLPNLPIFVPVVTLLQVQIQSLSFRVQRSCFLRGASAYCRRLNFLHFLLQKAKNYRVFPNTWGPPRIRKIGFW
jgi:hypothetical protein